jgi:hypothetical protein
MQKINVMRGVTVCKHARSCFLTFEGSCLIAVTKEVLVKMLRDIADKVANTEFKEE